MGSSQAYFDEDMFQNEDMFDDEDELVEPRRCDDRIAHQVQVVDMANRANRGEIAVRKSAVGESTTGAALLSWATMYGLGPPFSCWRRHSVGTTDLQKHQNKRIGVWKIPPLVSTHRLHPLQILA